jgi:hypothetical protein
MTDTMPFDTAIRLIFESLLSGVHTAFPAKVEAFDSVTMRCDIQPCLKKKYAGEDPINAPKITDVPVMYPSIGNFMVVGPVQVGSYGLAICSERAIDTWHTQGGIVDPGDPRKFEITDAIFIPGLFPLVNVLVPPMGVEGIEIRNLDGSSILRLTDTEIQLQCGTLAAPVVDYAVKYDQLKIAFDQLKLDLNGLIEKYNAHTQIVDPGTLIAASPAAHLATSSTADMSSSKVENVRLP